MRYPLVCYAMLCYGNPRFSVHIRTHECMAHNASVVLKLEEREREMVGCTILIQILRARCLRDERMADGNGMGRTANTHDATTRRAYYSAHCARASTHRKRAMSRVFSQRKLFSLRFTTRRGGGHGEEWDSGRRRRRQSNAFRCYNGFSVRRQSTVQHQPQTRHVCVVFALLQTCDHRSLATA